MPKQYSPEVLVLRDRVKRGNDVLFKAWLQIRELAHDSEEWSRQMELWHQAGKKLSLLCTELKLRDYCDCLYRNEKGERTRSCLDNPDQFWCQVCPSNISYWDKELMSLGGRNNEQRKITS